MTARILENFISNSEIQLIKNHYVNRPFEVSQNHWDHTDHTEKLQCESSKIDKWIWDEILDSKLKSLFGTYQVSEGCGEYLRCHMPFKMHSDSKQRMDESRANFPGSIQSEGVALLIPLNEGPHFCTVFWDEYFATHIEEIEMFEKFLLLPDEEVKNSNISQKYDLDFCWKNNERKIQDHLKFDLAFHWKVGNAVTWTRNQLHASVDFYKHGLVKDCLTIFFE